MSNLKGKIGLMTAALITMSFLAPSSILAALVESFPDTRQQMVQMLLSVPNLTSIVTSILISKVTPYIYKRHLLLLSGIFYPVAGLLIYFIHPNVMVMILFSLLMGIGTGICVTCVPSLICDCYDEKESARLIGMQAGFVSGGAMLFTWIGGQLAKTRWENCYLCYLFIIILFFIELICLPKGKLSEKKAPGEKSAAVPKSVLCYTGLSFFFGILIYVFSTNISLLVSLRSFGGTVESSYASMIYSLCGIAAGYVTGFVVSRLRYRTFACGLLVSVVGMLVCFFSGNYAVLCIGSAFCGISFSVVVPAGNYFASTDSTDCNRAFCVALFNAGTSLGQFFSPLFFGLLTFLAVQQRFLFAGVGLAVLFLIAMGIKAKF